MNAEPNVDTEASAMTRRAKQSKAKQRQRLRDDKPQIS